MTFVKKKVVTAAINVVIAVAGASARLAYLIVSMTGREEMNMYRPSVIQCLPQFELSSSFLAGGGGGG